MDVETAAKRTCDAWFSEALDDARLPHLEKPAASNVVYPQDVEVRVGKLQRQQERRDSDADQLRKDQMRVSDITLHERCSIYFPQKWYTYVPPFCVLYILFVGQKPKVKDAGVT